MHRPLIYVPLTLTLTHTHTHTHTLTLRPHPLRSPYHLAMHRYVQTLDMHNQVDTIKAAYNGILPAHIDQSAFFKHKGWDYERGSPSRRR